MYTSLNWVIIGSGKGLFSTNPFPEPILTLSQLDAMNKLQWYFNENTAIFIRQNEFENVTCKMFAI